MTILGFHASHAPVPHADLLDAVVLAEEVGFTAAMCSDHFSPWSERQVFGAKVIPELGVTRP
jgi:alkanesulfonate monooxygenase SsuD/methylene tetrahydromethanopterin reductase-like flavin-dependent oxidoreductase (luciferase family)